jgi:hypothetical protein
MLPEGRGRPTAFWLGDGGPTRNAAQGRVWITGQRSRYQVHQLVGACNSRPAPEVAKVVGTFLEEINNRVRASLSWPAPSRGGADDEDDFGANPKYPNHEIHA